MLIHLILPLATLAVGVIIIIVIFFADEETEEWRG